MHECQLSQYFARACMHRRQHKNVRKVPRGNIVSARAFLSEPVATCLSGRHTQVSIYMCLYAGNKRDEQRMFRHESGNTFERNNNTYLGRKAAAYASATTTSNLMATLRKLPLDKVKTKCNASPPATESIHFKRQLIGFQRQFSQSQCVGSGGFRLHIASVPPFSLPIFSLTICSLYCLLPVFEPLLFQLCYLYWTI